MLMQMKRDRCAWSWLDDKLGTTDAYLRFGSLLGWSRVQPVDSAFHSHNNHRDDRNHADGSSATNSVLERSHLCCRELLRTLFSGSHLDRDDLR